MEIQRVPFELPPLEDDPRRSKGLHLSAIIKSILLAVNEEKYRDGPVTQAVRNKWMIGYLWEEVLSQAYLRREIPKVSGYAPDFRIQPHLVTQQEVTFDGVYMTPDAFDIRTWELHEYKATWKSSRQPIDGPEFAHWRWQMMAYCLAMETTVAWLHPLFVNGDYRGSGPSAEWQYRFQFTPREISENWIMLKNHAISKGML